VTRATDVGGTGEQRLGKYELLRPLAVGGMAELHLARVTGLGGFEKTLVLKRIHRRLSDSEESLQLFLQEARLVASLQHPNIAQVFDVGMADGRCYLAMEHVEGHDLRIVQWAALRRDGGVPLAIGIGVVLGACAGLHHAHEKLGPDGRPLGIVHRDVSPSNILVSYDGFTKLVDFGIAKVTGSPTLTRDGAVRGKTSYLSPEQCHCEPLDRRADVFSLGIVLYELTTASRLFVGQSELEIMKRITEEPVPPPSSRRAAYPLALERIVLRALAPSREDRYQTAEELQLDLEAFARERKLPVTAPEVAKYVRGLLPAGGAAWVDELHEIQAQREKRAAAAEAEDAEADPHPADAPDLGFSPIEQPTRSFRIPKRPRRAVPPRAAIAFAGLVMAVTTGLLAARMVADSAPSTQHAAYALPVREATPVLEAVRVLDEPGPGPVAAVAVLAKAPKEHRPRASARPRLKLAARVGPAPVKGSAPAPAAPRRSASAVLDPWPTR
jgi:tRNA A-37 threonylcarbamoyl transferase component Bud32